MERLRKFLRAYFRVFHLTRATGRENLPPPGPALFASNHQSYYDPVFVAAEQNLPIKFMAWDELFKYGLLSKFISDWGAFPVDTEGEDGAGYRTCLDLLKNGERVLIFPEGGRADDYRILPLKAGVARLAIRTAVPIVPVCISGADCAWPRNDFCPRPFFRIDIHFHPAIIPRPVKGPKERHEESDRIMKELARLLQPSSRL